MCAGARAAACSGGAEELIGADGEGVDVGAALGTAVEAAAGSCEVVGGRGVAQPANHVRAVASTTAESLFIAIMRTYFSIGAAPPIPQPGSYRRHHRRELLGRPVTDHTA